MNRFERRVHAVDPGALYARALDVLQLNVGRRCNMRCAHCHQHGAPEVPEHMPESVVAASLEWARALRPGLVDLTGGAPELHPRIRSIADALLEQGRAVQVRTNLTVLLEPGCSDLVERWAGQQVALLASLPSCDREQTDQQRGSGAFDASIEALRRLNAAGYGAPGGPRLDLASNPTGACLPDDTRALERRFRDELAGRHGVRFHGLRVLTNVPVGRFRRQLVASGRRRAYLEQLRSAFNPATVARMGCRTGIAVAPAGALYDCDFNLGARLTVRDGPPTVLDAHRGVSTRRIAFGEHCFACTAQSGSS